jgi:DNA gyrase subunit A
MAIRFNENEIRPVGRTAQGVIGIRLGEKDYVVGMVAVTHPDATLLVVCENGYGKRTDIDAYRLTHRGGKGIISIKTSARNGGAVCIMEVVNDDELIIVTSGGILIRLPIVDIRTIGRVTQGVRLINLNSDDLVVDVERVPAGENEDIDDLTGMENGEEDEDIDADDEYVDDDELQ